MPGSRDLGVLFTGQGFDARQIVDFDARLKRYPDVREQYEATFQRACPSAAGDFTLNENSVLALCLSAFENHRANPELRERALVASGYSVGFYLALWYSGVLDQTAVCRLLFKRCRAMNAAATERSGLVAVLGLPLKKIESLIAGVPLAEGEILCVSNDNGVGNATVGGTEECLRRFADIAAASGAYKVVPLSVTAAWHTPLMRPAVDALKDALRGETFGAAAFQVIENVNAEPFPADAAERARVLCEHLWKPVRWRDCVTRMIAAGAQEFVELSDFDLLTKLGPSISRKAAFRTIGAR